MDSTTAPLPPYRAYRSEKLKDAEKSSSEPLGVRSRTAYPAERLVEHPLKAGRRRVAALRSRIDSEVRYPEVGDTPPDLDCANLRRSLGIPQYHRLTDPRWVKVLKFIRSFLPSHLNVALVQDELRNVRTFEGRRIVFERTHSLLFWNENLYYDRSFDFALRQLDGSITLAALKQLGSRPARWLRALYKLGLESASAQLEFPGHPLASDQAALVEILVAEGAIKTAAELAQWWPWETEDPRKRAAVAPDQEAPAREVVRHLVRLGGDRRAIVLACLDSDSGFDPEKLLFASRYLESKGLQPAGLVGAAGNRLWLAYMSMWRFLCEVVGVSTCEELALFAKLIEDSRAQPGERLARALLASGAKVADVAACQRLLKSSHKSYQEDGALLALDLLRRTPFAFDFTAIGQITAYAEGNERLPGFLDVLKKHGLTQQDDVLAFERCLRFRPDTIDQLLGLMLPLRGQAPVTELADRVLAAASTGQPDAFAVLIPSLRLETLGQVKSAMKFAPLGEKVLRYVIVDKRLSSSTALEEWFYRRAEGVLDASLPGSTLSDVERICLDDAFMRRSFGWVRHNVREMWDASSVRASAVVAELPMGADETTIQRYHEERAAAMARQRPRLLADLKKVLAATDGIVLSRIFASATVDDASIDAALAEFKPLLQDLLAGRGPAGKDLTALEVDAISMVYRTPPGVVEDLWPELIGRESDLNSLRLAASYPMTWRAEAHVLRDGAVLDTAGLSMLAAMSDRSDQFARDCLADMSQATQGLRPSRIGDAAADRVGLSQHLSVLCAIAGGDELAASALSHWKSDRAKMAEGTIPFSDVLRIENFFSTTLPDAIEAEALKFARKLAPKSADELAGKLSLLASERASPAERLSEAASHAMQWVQRPFLKWARKERKKFVPVGAADSETILHAVLTKSPAAFFGKGSAGLCTRADTDMWNEARHSHLVVFDLRNKRLAGMAMVYVQVIPQIDRQRPTLVIRALNPIEPYSSQHNASSIIQGFVETAVKIAKDNGLAAVALPGNSSEHLLTNNGKIEDALSDGYMRSAYPHCDARSVLDSCEKLNRPLKVTASFSGYAEGKAVVSWLGVIWIAGMDGAVTLDKRHRRR